MKRLIVLGWIIFLPILFADRSWAQPGQSQDNRGLIGVFVSPSDRGGMAIEGFIRNTPASKLNRQGEINRGDTIVKLAGREVNSINSLTRARNLIPFGKEGRMVLRDRRDNFYFVWIGRKDPAVARAAVRSEGLTGEEAIARISDNFSFGGQGQGEDQADIRDPRTGKAVKALSAEESTARAEEEFGDDANIDPSVDVPVEDSGNEGNPDIR